MIALVELPLVSGSTVWLNPDHVVSVLDCGRRGCMVVTPLGERHHVDLEPEVLVRRLEGTDPRKAEAEAMLRRLCSPHYWPPGSFPTIRVDPASSVPTRLDAEDALDLDPDVRDRVKENLERGDG